MIMENCMLYCYCIYNYLLSKKESILDLTKFLEKPVRVKFAGNILF